LLPPCAREHTHGVMGVDAAASEYGSPPVAAEPALTLVTLVFDAADGAAERLLAILARYVVVSRAQPGCRNIDLCASATRPGRYVVVEKWETPAAQRAHFDSEEMVRMAESSRALLAAPPEIDLLDAISAHDLA
jgi:quinol monooxygenase YgiN